MISFLSHVLLGSYSHNNIDISEFKSRAYSYQISHLYSLVEGFLSTKQVVYWKFIKEKESRHFYRSHLHSYLTVEDFFKNYFHLQQIWQCVTHNFALLIEARAFSRPVGPFDRQRRKLVPPIETRAFKGLKLKNQK